jgi:hypothetical protein
MENVGNSGRVVEGRREEPLACGGVGRRLAIDVGSRFDTVRHGSFRSTRQRLGSFDSDHQQPSTAVNCHQPALEFTHRLARANPRS